MIIERLMNWYSKNKILYFFSLKPLSYQLLFNEDIKNFFMFDPEGV